MEGRKVPWTKSKALAYMYCNPCFGKGRFKLKRQARKEDRRYSKGELLNILTEETFQYEDNEIEVVI